MPDESRYFPFERKPVAAALLGEDESIIDRDFELAVLTLDHFNNYIIEILHQFIFHTGSLRKVVSRYTIFDYDPHLQKQPLLPAEFVDDYLLPLARS